MGGGDRLPSGDPSARLPTYFIKKKYSGIKISLVRCTTESAPVYLVFFFFFGMRLLLTLVYVRGDRDKVDDGARLPRRSLFTLTEEIRVECIRKQTQAVSSTLLLCAL